MMPRASEDMPIGIADTYCPTAGYDHILQCTHDQDKLLFSAARL